MTAELAGSLAVLALVDSTSFGTLLIPLWLMLTPGRFRPGRVLVFLSTVAAFYLVLGIALTAGTSTLLDQAKDWSGSGPVQVVQLMVGVVLMVLGLTIEPWTRAGKAKRAAQREAKERREGPGRLTRWRHRAMTGEEGPGALVKLALSAVAIEALSMLPYLAAIGLLITSTLNLAASSLVLVGYCVVMIAPALALLAVRVVLHDRIAGVLTRVEQWLTKSSREALAWVLFLLGLYVTSGAASALGMI